MKGSDRLTAANYQLVVREGIRRIPEDLRCLVGYQMEQFGIVITVSIPDPERECRIEKIVVQHFYDIIELREQYVLRMPWWTLSKVKDLVDSHSEKDLGRQFFFLVRPLIAGGWMINVAPEALYVRNMVEAVSTAILDVLVGGGVIRIDNRCRYFRLDGSRIQE